MRQDAVSQLGCQHRREIRNLPHRIHDHLIADDDMTDQLPLIRIIISGEIGQLTHLADVVAEGRRHQQISVQIRIVLRKIITDRRHGKGMLHQSAHIAVVHRLRCRMRHEFLPESGILHEQKLQQTMQIRILHRLDVPLQLLRHFLQ